MKSGFPPLRLSGTETNCKIVVVVDADVDIFNLADVMWASRRAPAPTVTSCLFTVPWQPFSTRPRIRSTTR